MWEPSEKPKGELSSRSRFREVWRCLPRPLRRLIELQYRRYVSLPFLAWPLSRTHVRFGFVFWSSLLFSWRFSFSFSLPISSRNIDPGSRSRLFYPLPPPFYREKALNNPFLPRRLDSNCVKKTPARALKQMYVPLIGCTCLKQCLKKGIHAFIKMCVRYVRCVILLVVALCLNAFTAGNPFGDKFT